MTLVDKYRPDKFRDVIGQDFAVRVLGQLILRGKQRRNLLLQGPIGSGKTTLARIYGLALNCENIEDDGSPCGHCSKCASGDLHFTEYDGTRVDQDVSQIVQGIPLGQIIFIDEAHALGDRLEKLLKPLEEGAADFTLILATSKPQLIPSAVISRLWNVPLHPMSIGQSVRFLKRVADQEAIEAEVEALYLLAGQCEGQARDLLHALDQARSAGKVTLASVRDQLGISFSDAAVRYLEALARGSYEQQAKAFYEWNETGAQKLGFVQNFLASVFFRESQKLPVTVDARLEAIPVVVRQRIVDAWRERIGLVAFPAYLRSLIKFWPVVTPDLAEAAINLHIARFHELVNNVPATKPSKTSPSPKRQAKHASTHDNPLYLSLEDTRAILDSSSAMVQEYGILFNAKITIWYHGFGIDDIAGAAELAERFHGFIRNHLKQLGTGSGFRISVMGKDDKKGPWTRIIAAVPPDKMESFQDKVVSWRKTKQSEVQNAIECEVITAGKSSYTYHRACVRWLCEGVDPELKGNSGKKLVDLLKIPKLNRIAYGDIGSHNRVNRTEYLLDTARKVCTANKMSYLLPFDVGEYERVLGSWELEEYADRKKLQRKRAFQVNDLEIAFEHDADALGAAKEKLLATWDANPCNRDRRWPTWWSAEPL